MASPLSRKSLSVSPPKGPSRRASATQSIKETDAATADSDLLQSLTQLSLGTSPSPDTKSRRISRPQSRSQQQQPLAPGPYRPTINRPPSSRSLNGTPSATNRTPSRSATPATPTLLRKASMNSLHSANGVAPPRRASSVNINQSASPRSPLRGISPLDAPSEPPPPTAASVAHTHFARELTAHHGPRPSGLTTETVVFLHDSCYGHRFSRPRTSRVALGTIVERPERLKASALGVAAAYVRLGERHQDGVFSPHPRLDPATLPSVPFRIQKTARRLPLTSQAVTNVHGTKWMEELRLMCGLAEAKLALNGKELQRPEMDRGGSPGETPEKFHEGDLYLCAESLDAFEGALGGVCDAVDTVFNPQGPKRAFVAIRPPGHHCSATYPSGFCWINNVHVGIMHAILGHGLTHAAIVDFDLHHGDGSQAIAWAHNARGTGLAKNAAWWKKTSIGYFSLHDINSYPCEAGDEEKVKNASLCIENAHGQTVWNVHLQPWKSEADFWRLYGTRYGVLLDKVRVYLRGQTERLRAAGLNARAAVFVSAGFDASEWEGAGMQRHNVNVPTEFYARLTRDIVRLAAEESTAAEGRIVSVLEGGYSDRALTSGVLSHLCGLAGDDPVLTRDQEYNGLGYEMGSRVGGGGGGGGAAAAAAPTVAHVRKDSSASDRGTRPYEASWWMASELDRLEALVAPPPSTAVDSKKAPGAASSTYSSPTASSTAKVVTASPKVRRSVSGTGGGLLAGANGASSRVPTPPPPEVPWTVATHELSKLLIPTGRATESCRHEDLNAEATRVRRDRQQQQQQQQQQQVAPNGNGGTVPGRAPTRMALRERKPKLIVPIDEEDKMPKNTRRRTVAGTSGSDLPHEKPAAGGAVRQASRRLSAASTMVSEVPEMVAVAAGRGNGDSAKGFTAGAGTRPGTALTVRPESSVSVRSNAGPGASTLAVKKTRALATKKEPAAPRARGPQKKVVAGAAATAATAPAGVGAGPKAVVSTNTLDASNAPVLRIPEEPADSDLDSLANDFRKVKITIVTKEQREARERERLACSEAEREKAATSASSPSLLSAVSTTVPSLPALHTLNGVVERPIIDHGIISMSPTRLDTTADSSLGEYHNSNGYLVLPTSSSLTPAASTALADPQYVQLPASPGQKEAYQTPTISSLGPVTPPPALDADFPFVAYQPEDPIPFATASAGVTSPNRPIQWLPPNTIGTSLTESSPSVSASTPASASVLSPMRRIDLPVFSATSAIPFAGPGTSEGAEGAETTQRPRLDVPEVMVEDETVWDVPDTPLRRG